ncbi:MAG TPA: VWA domain-containing protein [Bryobacteraceae bacterium]|nr:VWA domain-containing protein [Bryobacteraceae bacterium]
MGLRSVVFLGAALLAAAQDGVVFHSDVALVHVDAEVNRADGAILSGLVKEDFRVLDEGKEQAILHFSADEEPLDLILLFDVSGSMRPIVESVAAAAREALRELRPGDRVSVMVFNTVARVIAPFTEDLDAVDHTIENDLLGMRFGGGTFIQQAVDDAALQFMREKKSQRRRAVLIVTDNIGTRTRRTDSVVRDFWEADAILSGLIVRNPVYQARRTVGIILGPQNLALQAGMTQIALKTGGDTIHSGEPANAFRDAMRRIRARYGLYYALPQAKAGSHRSVHVELAPLAAKRYPASRVRARTGYVVPATL